MSSSGCNGTIGTPSSLPQTRALTLSGSCLQPGGTYRFTFEVDDGQGGSSQAWMNITVLQPPNGGTCEAANLTGVSLVAAFHITCNGWKSSNSILTYSLKRVDSDGQVVALSTMQYTPSFDVILNGEVGVPQSSVMLMVVVSDTVSTTNVYVGPLNLSSPSSQPVVCPLSSLTNVSGNVQIIQYLTTAVQSPAFQTTAVCEDQRQTIWLRLWDTINSTILTLPYIGGDSVELYVNALECLKQTSSLVVPPPNFNDNWSILSNKLLADGEVTPNATKAVLQALPVISDCAMMQQTLSLAGERFSELTSIGNPGESPYVIQGSLLTSLTSQKFFTGSNSQLGTSSASIYLPTSLLIQGSGSRDGVSTVIVSEYNDALAGCRQGPRVVSTIVDITLGTSQSHTVQVNDVSGGFSFSTAITAKDGEYCGKPVCAWWKPASEEQKHGEWSRVGCVTQSTDNAPYNVTCLCAHLTEFSLILRPGCVSKAYQIAYYSMLACYAAVLVAIVGKLGLYYWKNGGKICAAAKVVEEVRMGIVLWQHFMLALLSIARIVSCAVLAQNRQDWSIAGRAVVLLLPYMIQFWIYTLLAFQWASIYHFGMKTHNPFSRVRPIFIASNIIIVACVIATIVVTSLASPPSLSTSPPSSSFSQADVVVTVASTLIACVTLLTAFSFLAYSVPLYKAMRKGDTGSTTRDTSRRLIVGAVSLQVLLCLQAFLHVNSAVLNLHLEAVVGGDVSELVVLGADVLCIITILAMYHHAMMAATPSSREQVELS